MIPNSPAFSDITAKITKDVKTNLNIIFLVNLPKFTNFCLLGSNCLHGSLRVSGFVCVYRKSVVLVLLLVITITEFKSYVNKC